MATTGGALVARPAGCNAYEFAVIASLRAKQLLAGCRPHVEGDHNASTKAQMEVAVGKVARVDPGDPQPGRQCLWQI